MSWFSQAFNWIGDTVSNAIPNEIKDVVSDIIPNEIEKYIDPKNLLNANLNAKPSTPAGVAPAGGAPTYDKTLLDAFNAQLAIEPKLLEANKLFQPQWLELQKQSQATTAKNQMDLMAQLYPQAGTIEAAYQNQLRGNELRQLQTTLPQYQQAIQSLTPGYAQAIASTGQLAQQSMQRSLQAPQLTNFEAQVGGPYGPAIQQGMQPQGQPAQGAAFVPGVSQGPVTAQQLLPTQAPAQAMGQTTQFGMGQALQDQMAQGRQFGEQKTWQDAAQPAYQSTDPNGPAYFAPRGNQPSQGAAMFDVRSGVSDKYKLLGQQAQTYLGQGKSLPSELVDAIRQEEQAMGQARMANAAPAPRGNQPSQGAPIPANQQAMQAPQGQQMMAYQSPQSLQQTPAGGYVGQVQQFQPANVGAMAGTPQEVGYLGTVGNAQQTAALAGNVPGMENLDATRSAQMAAASAGRVPGGTAMQGAQTAAKALSLAGQVPAARNLAGVRGPQLQSGLENVNQGSVDQYLSAMPGMQDYARMLAQQSQEELSAGRGLTAEEQRMADQSARAAYAARGTALGSQAVNAEILNRADVSNQRYQQRLQNAAQAAGTIQGIYQPALAQSLQRQQGSLQYGLEAQGQAFGQAETKDTLNAQLQAQRFGQLSGTQQAGFAQAQAKDAFGRDTQAQKYAQAMGTQAAGFGQAQTKDTMAAQLQQQRYNQLMGAQGTAFEQAGARENVAQQIQQQRYGQAMGQQGLLQGAQGQAYNQAMGREQLGASTQQSAFNQALQRGQAEQQRLQFGTNYQAGQAQLGAGSLGQLQTAQGSVFNAYNKQPLLQQTVNQAQTMGLANQQAAGNTLFQPESPLAFQSAFLPYQSNIALQQAQMQANAAKSAGTSSMIGNLGGAAIGAMALFCWVAREVYGSETGTWKVFRSWMLEEAPAWLRNAYIKYGPKIADFIKDKPVLKAIIRKWMDSKIEAYLTA